MTPPPRDEQAWRDEKAEETVRDPEETVRDASRKLQRTLGLFIYGYVGAAVLVALLGGALVAWILGFAGLPFLSTWTVIVALVLAVPLLALAARELMNRRR